MSWRQRLIDVVVWTALLVAVWLCASVLLRPTTTVASVTRDPGVGAEPEMPSAPAPRRASIPEIVCEIQDALLGQPDVAKAIVTASRHPVLPLAVTVQITWAWPFPPPPRRLDTIAHWVHERMAMPCEVSVVTPETRHDVVYE